MNRLQILPFIILISLGIFIFLYGGYDDSPGAQGLGLVLFCIGIYCVKIKIFNKK